MKVSPTTAYVGDQTTGKLTIYVTYFGKTAMGQKSLSANGSGGVSLSGATRGMEILPKKSDDTKATVKFKLEGEETASPSNGSCTIVFDQNYTITSRGTEGNTQYVTAGTFSNSTAGTQWLSKSTAAGAYSYNSSTKEFTQEISIKKNDTGSNRAGAVIVYSPSGREVTRFVIEQDGFKINKLVDNSDAANCYIISKPGRYELPAYEGAIAKDNLANATLLTGTPDVVWNDNTSNTFKFYKDHLATNKIIIDINPTTDVASPAKDSNGKITDPNCNVTGYSESISPGNALVSIKDAKGNILWSWHLWFCTPSTIPDDNLNIYPKTNNNVMNRALGATDYLAKDNTIMQYLSEAGYNLEVWTDGLYYQWGRKDPLVAQNPQTGGSNAAITKHPYILYSDWTSSDQTWSAKHDPCPPGYKVPGNAIWVSDNSSDGLEDIIARYPDLGYPYNLELSVEIAKNVVYPYSNFLENGKVFDIKDPKPIPYTNRQEDLFSISSFKVTALTSGNDYIVKKGMLWANDGLLYYNLLDTEITGDADIFIYYNNKWYPRNPGTGNGWTVGNLESDLISSVSGTIAKTILRGLLSTVDLDKSAKEAIEELESARLVPELVDRSKIPSNYTGQIRCVKK